MNTAHHGPGAEDSAVDPTGMRDVLAGLPDPGPMPDHVAARIQQSIAQEQAGVDDGAWAADPAIGPAVADLSAERRRRRPAQWIMAAAAVVTVGVIGTVVFDQVLGAGSGADSVAAQYSPDQDDEAADAAGGEAESEAGSDSGEDDVEAADGTDEDAEQGEALAQEAPREDSASLIQGIDDTTFADGAALMLQAGGTSFSGLPAEFAGSPTLDPLPADSVDNCVQALGEDPQEGQWAAAPARINGSDVVVVGDLTPTRSRAWAVSEQCPEDPGAEILNGPVPLP